MSPPVQLSDMPSPIHPPSQSAESRSQSDSASSFVNEESLILRNYDSEEAYEVTVALTDAADDTAFRETYTLGPAMTLRIGLRLQRAIYDVSVSVDDTRRDTAECLIGSGPEESAVIEVGNGQASVVWRGH